MRCLPLLLPQSSALKRILTATLAEAVGPSPPLVEASTHSLLRSTSKITLLSYWTPAPVPWNFRVKVDLSKRRKLASITAPVPTLCNSIRKPQRPPRPQRFKLWDPLYLHLQIPIWPLRTWGWLWLQWILNKRKTVSWQSPMITQAQEAVFVDDRQRAVLLLQVQSVKQLVQQ